MHAFAQIGRLTSGGRAGYSAAGMVLALGAPAGWMVLSALLNGYSTPAALADDISANSTLYLYLTVATSVAFTTFGYRLGVQAEQLRRAASIDHLTGLVTRQRLFDFLDQALAEAVRYRRPIAVVMVDIDHFKHINDRFGHLAGDDVLRAIARSLVEGKRRPDITGRFGGEEFLIVLPETTVEEAFEFAERTRARIAAERVPWGGNEINVTVSLGVAGGVPADASWGDRLVEAADAALYEAKRAGRNVVRIGKTD